jgi:hypothetical protein
MAVSDAKVTRIHKFVGWTGWMLLVGYTISWGILGHNIPPPDPSWSATELVQNYYVKYKSNIMIGESLAAFFGLLYLPWTCLITIHMRRREKEPLLAYINLAGGLLNAWVLAFCPAIWIYAAESAGTVDPEITKTLHFVGWYIYDTTYMVASLQGFAIGAFALTYQDSPVLFPRWAGWVAIFMAVSFFSLTAMPFFKTGPIALNGWLSFHIVFLSFFVFCITFTIYILREAARQKVNMVPTIGQAISNR